MARTCCSRRAHQDELVRWGPVSAAAVIGATLFAMLESLWLASAHGSGSGWLSGTLPLVIGCSAALALFVAGLLSGLLSEERSEWSAAANGAAAWAVSVLVSLVTVIPATAAVMPHRSNGRADSSTTAASMAGPGVGLTVESALWTGFCALSIGLVLAVLGAVLGGAMRHPVVLVVTPLHQDQDRSPGPEWQPYGDPLAWGDPPVGPRTLRIADPRPAGGDDGSAHDGPPHHPAA